MSSYLSTAVLISSASPVLPLALLISRFPKLIAARAPLSSWLVIFPMPSATLSQATPLPIFPTSVPRSLALPSAPFMLALISISLLRACMTCCCIRWNSVDEALTPFRFIASRAASACLTTCCWAFICWARILDLFSR